MRNYGLFPAGHPRVMDAGPGTLLFHRLSIMGVHPEGMQPFTAPDGSAVVCNGELYGFRKTREELREKGYTFRSDSDCELLLPLWREYGVELFPLLDAEFALILYDAAAGEFIVPSTTGRAAPAECSSPASPRT